MRFLLLSSLVLATLAASAVAQPSRELAQTAVQARVSGKSGPEGVALFSKYNPSGEFVRSRASWVADLDFSGLSVWNTANLDGTGGNRGYGTLIARRVVVFANHFHPGPGSTLVFLGRDNQLVSRKLLDTQRVGLTDICLGLLDRDVPETVSVYPVLGSEYAGDVRKPPALEPNPKLTPVISLNQKREALIHEWVETAESVGHRPAQAPALAPLTAPNIIGDSGAPIFLLLGRQLVLLGCHYTANSAPLVSVRAGEIETIMAQWNAGKLRRTKWTPGPMR